MKTSKPEKALQKALKSRKIKFKSHYKINNHRVDIFIKPNVCVEVDGRIFHNYPFGTPKDQRETSWLRLNGYTVLRFWDDEVLDDPELIADNISSYTKDGKIYSNLFDFTPVKLNFKF